MLKSAASVRLSTWLVLTVSAFSNNAYKGRDQDEDARRHANAIESYTSVLKNITLGQRDPTNDEANMMLLDLTAPAQPINGMPGSPGATRRSTRL